MSKYKLELKITTKNSTKMYYVASYNTLMKDFKD